MAPAKKIAQVSPNGNESNTGTAYVLRLIPDLRRPTTLPHWWTTSGPAHLGTGSGDQIVALVSVNVVRISVCRDILTATPPAAVRTTPSPPPEPLTTP